MFPRKNRQRIVEISNGTLVHSSHSCAHRRIAMTDARPDDSLSICMGIIRLVRLAAGRTIRLLPSEMNAPVAIAKEESFSIVFLLDNTGTCRWSSAIHPFFRKSIFLLTAGAFA
jgi:hypothetical protein